MKENYYKLYTPRNQLLLVSPTLPNVVDFLDTLLEGKVNRETLKACPSGTQRFFEGYRIVNVKL